MYLISDRSFENQLFGSEKKLLYYLVLVLCLHALLQLNLI